MVNPPFESELEFDDSFLNGNLSIQYDISDDVMFYGSYGVGSKTGGFAESAEISSANPALSVADNGARVESEETNTFEIGAKMKLAGGSASLNVAVFNTEIDDFQETSFLVSGGQAFFLTRNIDVESDGFEVDGLWQVTEGFRLIGGATYADSINAFDGTKLAQAPEWTGNLGFLFERELWSETLLSVTGFARYRDDMFSQINETFASDSLTTLDLSLGLEFVSGWNVDLIATNLTDEVSADFSGPPAAPIGAIFGAPPGDQGITADSPSPLRSIKVQVSTRF